MYCNLRLKVYSLFPKSTPSFPDFISLMILSLEGLVLAVKIFTPITLYPEEKKKLFRSPLFGCGFFLLWHPLTSSYETYLVLCLLPVFSPLYRLLGRVGLYSLLSPIPWSLAEFLAHFIYLMFNKYFGSFNKYLLSLLKGPCPCLSQVTAGKFLNPPTHLTILSSFISG